MACVYYVSVFSSMCVCVSECVYGMCVGICASLSVGLLSGACALASVCLVLDGAQVYMFYLLSIFKCS